MLWPLLTVHWALAGEPVPLVLPAGQPAGAWTAPAELAGLTLGPPGPGALVMLTDQGASWQVLARDTGGHQKAMMVPAPRSPAEREDVVLLATSLLSSLPDPPDLGQGPPRAPAPRPAPYVPAPPPTRRPAPTTKPKATVELLPPVPVPAVEPAPTPPPSEDPERPLAIPADPAPERPEPMVPTSPSPPDPALPPISVGGFARVGPTWSARPEAATAPGLTMEVGLTLGDRGHVGLGLRWSGERALSGLPSPVQMGDTEPFVGLAVEPGAGRVAPLLGLTGGVSSRRYTQEGVELDRVRVLVLSPELGAAVRCGEHLFLGVTANAGIDVDKTWIKLPDGVRRLQSPLSVGGALTAAVQIP